MYGNAKLFGTAAQAYDLLALFENLTIPAKDPNSDYYILKNYFETLSETLMLSETLCELETPATLKLSEIMKFKKGCNSFGK